MKKSVGVFSEEKLRELAERENATVMTPTHDAVYEPWPAVRVAECVDRLVRLARGGCTAEDAKTQDADDRRIQRRSMKSFSRT